MQSPSLSNQVQPQNKVVCPSLGAHVTENPGGKSLTALPL